MIKNSYKLGPDSDGNFGLFGGRYVAETLMPLILEVEKEYLKTTHLLLTLWIQDWFSLKMSLKVV